MANSDNPTGDGDGKTNGGNGPAAAAPKPGAGQGSITGEGSTAGQATTGGATAGGATAGQGAGQQPAGQQPGQAKAPPSMKILGQYLKDLSFENPNSPQSLSQQGQPEINVQVNVNAKPAGQNEFEVELHLEAKATHDGKSMFAADLLYAGVFRLENVPQEALHPIVLVECPRMLFPFARQILADATRNGGFPPLMLDPIDFASMYQRRLAEQQKSQQASA
jgi:preprotein translocase subunit SecB